VENCNDSEEISSTPAKGRTSTTQIRVEVPAQAGTASKWKPLPRRPTTTEPYHRPNRL